MNRRYVSRPAVAVLTLTTGAQWQQSFGATMESPDPASGLPAKVLAADGRVTPFKLANGTWSAAAGTADSLTEFQSGGVRTGWRYRDATANALYEFTARGLLRQVTQADGTTVALTYSDVSTPSSIATIPGVLIQAQDSSGRVLRFKSDANGIVQIAPPGAELDGTAGTDKAPIQYRYEAGVGQLTSVVYPNGDVRRYHYENTKYASALTGITDEFGQRFMTTVYDSDGRVSEQRRNAASGAVGRFAFDYSGSNTTVITTPIGTNITQSLTNLAGVNLPTGQNQPAGSGCAAASSASTYDAQGNPASRDDFNGVRSCFVHDAPRNLPTVSVEGLANTVACSSVTANAAALPAGSRKLSTAWHPDWRLQTRRAEPGRITTTVYNGQPDPFNGNAIASCAPGGALLPDGKPIAVACKSVEQATTDADGSQGFSATLQSGVANRVTSATYNARGQRLNATDALGNTTTYAYYADTTAEHTLGDLQSVTNAQGKVTQYTLYNQHGQLLKSTDANGVLTERVYDLRQRLTSISVAGETTRLDYLANGLLKRATDPDGSYIEQQYDGAQRLVAVLDHLGNRIDYTLDAAGNRTAENVKDAGGALARQLARVVDALGRPQSTTGRE